MDFSPMTLQYLKQTSLSYRKKMGQYFTPQKIIVQLINQSYTSVKNPTILDPSCGTGEFLFAAKKHWPNAQITGWEIDPNLVKFSKQLNPQANIKCIDTLKYKTNEKFDFVIGNPPYFEFVPDSPTYEKFKDVINGRVNIFSLFIKLSIDLLKPGGELAFVVPPSMNNGAYFLKLRKYIIDNCNIEYLKIINGANLFNSAKQNVMLLVLKKGKNKGNFWVSLRGSDNDRSNLYKQILLRLPRPAVGGTRNDTIYNTTITIFSENTRLLKNSFTNKKTLFQLGYVVKTGRLVWNQNKKLLTNDAKGNIHLIWSGNIGASKLIIPIKNKMQFVKTKDYDVGPAIVVNRIIGSINNIKIKAAIIPAGFKFIAENHVNVIYPPEKSVGNRPFGCAQGKHACSLQNIIKQLQSEKTIKLIRNITGNTQLSRTELLHLIPFDL